MLTHLNNKIVSSQTEYTLLIENVFCKIHRNFRQLSYAYAQGIRTARALDGVPAPDNA